MFYRLLPSLFCFLWIPFATAKNPFQPKEIPSLSLYSDFDFQETQKRMQKHSKKLFHSFSPWLEFTLRPYTDPSALWKEKDFQKVFWLTQYYFQRCKIRVKTQSLQTLQKSLLTKHNTLQYKFQTTDLPNLHPNEVLVLLPRQVPVVFSKNKKTTRLFGLSYRILLQTRLRKAVWTRKSFNITTLPHEIGHYWGLQHTAQEYNLMLNGALIRKSIGILGSALKGYLQPFLFEFSKQQCRKMRNNILRQPPTLKVSSKP